MGDLQVCSRQPNGVVREDRPFQVPFSHPWTMSNPDPSSIGDDAWAIAEEASQQLICFIHPTLDSEEKRKDVIEYIQRLLRCSIGCEVFSYGSVPLKTYLPDGDIDLTALCNPNAEENLPQDVLALLQAEEKNTNAEYAVKDTQFIDAEVKLVKCLVQDIIIDISFNQLGGLCSLCFLEQIDRFVGKDHLFKRSIILIKAWCYYESRILGAHHGLFSTYALETLVLYIFHIFHNSLNGPLAVLYKFLDYFSKFDWENYCISLQGPVRKSSLPHVVVEMPANVGDNVLLSEEFYKNCIDMFSVPSRGLDSEFRAFPVKFLNIIDPLKENNNLGRSVHRGNFYRIRCALKLGARKLGRILLLPRERIADEIKRFFGNTMERHGRKNGILSSSSHSRTLSEENLQLKSLILDSEENVPWLNNEFDRHSGLVSKMSSSVSGSHLAVEASLRIANDTSDSSSLSSDLSNSLPGLNYCAAPYYSGSSRDTGKLQNGFLDDEKLAKFVNEKMGFDSWMRHNENYLGVCSCVNNNEGVTFSGSGISSPDDSISEVLALDFRESDLSLNPLSDLSGDYDSHIRSLLYGQCCHGFALSASILPTPPTFPSQFQTKRSWDTVRRLMPLKHEPFSQLDSNIVITGPLIQKPMVNDYSSTSSSLSSSEGKPKPRGTGTFIPILNGCLCKERYSQGKGKDHVVGNYRPLQKHIRKNNSSASTLPDKKSSEKSGHEPRHPRSPIQSHGKSRVSQKSMNSVTSDSGAAGFSISSQKLEFGSLGQLPEDIGQLASDLQGSTPNAVGHEGQTSKTIPANTNRVGSRSFQLKDEGDFPPLSV